MKPKAKIKITVDILMTIFMLLLMAYYITGEKIHEWLGVGTFLLFVFHHILNWSWIRNLHKGKYNGYRIFQVAINALLFLCLIGQMISGIILSRYVFAFLSISGGISFARTLHHVCAYWAFVLISIHIGQHWGMMLGMAKKLAKDSGPQLNFRYIPSPQNRWFLLFSTSYYIIFLAVCETVVRVLKISAGPIYPIHDLVEDK